MTTNARLLGLKKKYENKMYVTGEDVTFLKTKTRFLHIHEYWDMWKEIEEEFNKHK